MKKIFVILTTLFCLVSCMQKGYDSIGEDCVPPYEHNQGFMLLRNYSSDDTVWFIPDKDHAENLPTESLTEWQKISVFTVPAHSSYELYYDSQDNYITPVETYGVEDRMVFYVFKKEIWDSKSWQELVEGQLWSGNCSLSVEEARAQNCTLTYPMQ
ncbi:MAG: hypothetical protein ACI4TL_06755 [Candidatus Cryptobacteroides sp.]